MDQEDRRRELEFARRCAEACASYRAQIAAIRALTTTPSTTRGSNHNTLYRASFAEIVAQETAADPLAPYFEALRAFTTASTQASSAASTVTSERRARSAPARLL